MKFDREWCYGSVDPWCGYRERWIDDRSRGGGNLKMGPNRGKFTSPNENGNAHGKPKTEIFPIGQCPNRPKPGIAGWTILLEVATASLQKPIA